MDSRTGKIGQLMKGMKDIAPWGVSEVRGGFCGRRLIDIYGIQFRTDPRFEAYNSSGYTYNAETQTMFLKSLHEVQREEVKLYYGGAAEEPSPSPSPTTSAQSSPEITGAGSYSGTVPR